MKPKKTLLDIVIGGVYKYTNNRGEVVCIGSTEYLDLSKTDDVHRNGHKYKNMGSYSHTLFRCNLRRPIAINDNWTISWHIEPREMTRKQLLELERDTIKEFINKGQCICNHHSDPLEAFIKKNG